MSRRGLRRLARRLRDGAPVPPVRRLQPELGSVWQDTPVGKSRNPEARRSATRKPPALSMVRKNPPSGAESDPVAGGLARDANARAELIAAMTASLLEEMAEARTPLAAERVLCGAFAAVEASLPDDADEEERLEALTLLLGQVIGQAQALATVDALALLRVCSVLGPATSQAAARKGAGQLAAAGVADGPWADRVGHPTMLRAWRYGDVFGAQSSVGVLFDYRGREHAVMVLVDHLLGGGIKDCWVSEGRSAKEMRNTVAAAMASEPGTFFEDIDADAVEVLLGSALTNPPCPEQADQIEDVANQLYLVRARVEHVAQLAGVAGQDGRGGRPS